MRDQITLCIIAGNTAQYIERFLRSFAPLVGKVVIVRAIGNNQPDDTFTIADDVCAELGLPLQKGWHLNNPANDWPHVDDFATARNLSFYLADTPWIAWSDTDDILQPGSAEAIHATLEKHGERLDGLTFEYEVPEDGLTVLKERILRRGSGSWRYAIHEEYAFNETPRLGRVPRAKIVHAPNGSRKANDERNVRLLESMGETMPPGHRFHYVNSLRAVGRIADSITEAGKLVQNPAIAQPERYELFMSLSQLAQQQGNETGCCQFLLNALGTDPTRREAYGDLTVWSIRNGRLIEALGYTRAMLALPRPRQYLWNARAKYYGWAGIQLHAMALRGNGDIAGGDAHEFNHFRAHGAKISLLHATRGRAKQAYQTKLRWFDRAADPDAIEHIFALDSDDPSAPAIALNRHVIVPPGGGCVRAWNAAAAISHGQILIQLSDDWDPPMHWDRIIMERIGDPEAPKVLAIADGHRTDRLLCMAILTRARYRDQGHLFHPDFLSVYSDDWFTHCAYRDGVVIEARDVIFEHKHPLFDSSVLPDQTYAESNTPQRYAQGKAVLDRLIAEESASARS